MSTLVCATLFSLSIPHQAGLAHNGTRRTIATLHHISLASQCRLRLYNQQTALVIAPIPFSTRLPPKGDLHAYSNNSHRPPARRLHRPPDAPDSNHTRLDTHARHPHLSPAGPAKTVTRGQHLGSQEPLPQSRVHRPEAARQRSPPTLPRSARERSGES